MGLSEEGVNFIQRFTTSIGRRGETSTAQNTAVTRISDMLLLNEIVRKYPNQFTKCSAKKYLGQTTLPFCAH